MSRISKFAILLILSLSIFLPASTVHGAISDEGKSVYKGKGKDVNLG